MTKNPIQNASSVQCAYAQNTQEAVESPNIFRLQDLAPEIRYVIYDFSIDLSGIEQWFDRYYETIKECPDIRAVPILQRRVKTPTILLVSKWVYTEAKVLLHKRHITLSHGLFDVGSITSICSAGVLQNITSLNITTSGHPMLQSNILADSWAGYMRLLSELARILAAKHSLTLFTLDLSDPDLIAHMSDCWNRATARCDYRDQLKTVLNDLRTVRAVGLVTVKGIPATEARALKQRMESKPVTFLNLPPEIRQKIYTNSLNWSDCTIKVAQTMAGWVNRRKSMPHTRRSTPTVLLLCRQITKEALLVLRKKPLKLFLSGETNLFKESEVPDLARFISPQTLQRVEHFELVIEKWEWVYVIRSIVAYLALQHNLKTFKICFHDALKVVIMEAGTFKYPDKSVHEVFAQLGRIRGIDKVVFMGDLPSSYTKPLAKIMQSSVTETRIPTLLALCGNGSLVNADDDDD